MDRIKYKLKLESVCYLSSFLLFFEFSDVRSANWACFFVWQPFLNAPAMKNMFTGAGKYSQGISGLDVSDADGTLVALVISLILSECFN